MTGPSATALLVYDGDCAFCTTVAQDIERHWDGAAEIRAWQQLGGAGLGELGLSLDDVQTAVWWVDADGTRFRGHRAVAKALIAAGGWRAVVGRVVAARVMTWPAAFGYYLAARYRHRLPGATDACRIDVSESGS